MKGGKINKAREQHVLPGSTHQRINVPADQTASRNGKVPISVSAPDLEDHHDQSSPCRINLREDQCGKIHAEQRGLRFKISEHDRQGHVRCLVGIEAAFKVDSRAETVAYSIGVPAWHLPRPSYSRATLEDRLL